MPPFPQYFQYGYLTKESNYMFFCEFGCSIDIFLNSANLKCQSTDISKFLEGPFDFEILRVECIADN